MNGHLSLLIGTDQEFFENDVYALLNPSCFDGNIRKKGVLSGLFFLEDITRMLHLMIQYVEHNKSPIAVAFSNIDHLISVFIDPSDRSFTFIDANYLPPKKIYDLEEVSEVIYRVTTNKEMDTAGKFPPIDKKGVVLGVDIVGIEGKLDTERMPRLKNLFTLEQISLRSQMTVSNQKWEHIAALHGDRDSIEAIIGQKGGRGLELLEALASRGRSDLFQRVFECRLKSMEKPYYGTGKIMFIAAENGHFQLVRTLFEHGVLVNGKVNEKTPLQIAARNGHIQIVEYFLCKRKDPRALNSEIIDSFIFAARGGHLNILKILVQKYPAIKSKQTLEKALLCGSIGEHFPVCRYIIEEGIYIDFRSEIDGLTPLIKSAIKGSLEQIKFLISLGASPFASCAEGSLPIEHAVRSGQAEIVGYLAQFHQPFNLFYNFKGESLLACAIRHGYLDVLKVLAENSVSLDKPDSSGKSALMYALEFKQKKIFSYLLSQKVSPIVKNNQGVSVLSRCISEGNAEFLFLVLNSP